MLQHSPHSDGSEHEAHSHPPHAPTSGHHYGEEQRLHSRASSIHELLNPSSSSESKEPTLAVSSQEWASSDASPLSSFEELAVHSCPTSADIVAGPTPEHDEKTSSGRKRGHAEMTSQIGVSITVAASRQPPKLPSQGSTVRLSMTAEGAVKIRTSDQETPSPPKMRALAPDMLSRRSGGLQRSKSAMEASEMSAHGSPLLGNPKVADGKLGRSRDARTWEFYCDNEARDSLSSHAEHERNGSAVGAINLIRSQSQRQLRRMLAPVASQSNTRTPAPLGCSRQRSKPKLARAKSSLARLQSVDIDCNKENDKSSLSQAARSPSGDSDKENWAPGTHSSQHPLRRPNTGSNTRPVLADNPSMLSYASGLHSQGHKGLRRIDGKENREPVLVSSKAKGSDFDCVQGLLSLSQGAWR